MSLELRVLQLENGIRKMTQQISTLSDEISKLKQCCCSNKFFILRDSIMFYPSADVEALNLNDRFTSEGVCNGAKGILLVEDATIFVEYQDWNAGWVFIEDIRVGSSLCCNESIE